MGEAIPIGPTVYALAGYLVLQVLLNLIIRARLRRKGALAIHALTATFWSSVVNALYFMVAAIVLHIYGFAPNSENPDHNYLLLALTGIPLGPFLWYFTTMGRKAGQSIFGRGGLIAAEEAILSVPPEARYIGWGVMNLAVIQPLGRELFMRGALLPTLLLGTTWPLAFAATLVVELLLRLNVTWALQTMVYTLALCGMYYATGTALTGLVAASISGVIQAAVLIRIGLRQVEAED